MKEVKAFIHRNRLADVIRALSASGFCRENCNLSVVDVKGTLAAIDNQERDYSMELGEQIITEAKIELVCQDERAMDAVSIIRDNAHTGQEQAGWVFVNDIDAAYPIVE